MPDFKNLPQVAMPVLLGASFLTSFELWTAHSPLNPITLVAIPIPFVWPLLASLVIWIFRPTAGALLYLAVFAMSLLDDATRLQPFVVSGAILLWSRHGQVGAFTVRAHVATLWLAAGVQKAISIGYWTEVTPWLTGHLFGADSMGLSTVVGSVIVVTEVLSGLTAFFGSAKATLRFACFLHLLIAGFLMVEFSNRSLIGWNLAVPVALYLAKDAEPDSLAALVRKGSLGRPVALAGFLLLPIVSRTWAPVAALSQTFYAADHPRTFWCDENMRCETDREYHLTQRRYGCAIPASTWHLMRFFLANCSAGDQWSVRDSESDDVLSRAVCPSTARPNDARVR